MYLRNIAFKNIGPMDILSVSLPFNQNGTPKPVIFVGENGSGKTILLSQIIDSLYEFASELFYDIGNHEGLNRSFYKISGNINLQSGKDKGFSLLRFKDNEDRNLEYFDKVGTLNKEEFNELLEDFSLSPNTQEEFQKKSTIIDDNHKKKLQDEWFRGVHFYQPAYRYEEPFWINKPFIDHQRFEDKVRFSGKLNKNIEILTSTRDNKAYLMDLVLDFVNNPSNLVDKNTWNLINNLLRKIKQRDDIRFGIGPRGGYRVSIVELNSDKSIKKQLLPSIDNLSLGESLLLNLFVNIIRQGDTPPKTNDQIEGIVAIDEIDVHLHTDLQSTVLPELIKMFPKIQFIVTTHSPLFLLGMKTIFGEDNFEIINMPDGELITIERFSEFENAYKILKETEKYENDIKQKIEESKKPILFVEGDYDKRYINKAAEHLEKSEALSKIQIFDTNGFGGLDKIWKKYDSKLSEVVPQNILLLYDCDINKQDNEKGKVFKRVIPTTEGNLLEKGIENLFTEEILFKAMQEKSAFIDITEEIKKTERGNEKIIPKEYEVNSDEKGNLCDWICNNAEREDFRGFKKIFQILEETIIPREAELG